MREKPEKVSMKKVKKSGEHQMTEQVSQCRFYMWRTVVALAHADHVVTQEERDFIENYLNNVPFSDEQKETLRADLEHAQDVDEMFDEITEASDRAEFFEFARMMVWCDGNYDAQEEKLFEYLKDSQMSRVNMGAMQELAQETRKTERLRRDVEDEELRERVKGLFPLLRFYHWDD
ncbi:MAG: hypothetical protein DHS20C02_10690 [Micavibrio sp.]|nr:MAG: hypothetical protein DHS20C02_10690 [Micavibrio sp.]